MMTFVRTRVLLGLRHRSMERTYANFLLSADPDTRRLRLKE